MDQFINLIDIKHILYTMLRAKWMSFSSEAIWTFYSPSACPFYHKNKKLRSHTNIEERIISKWSLEK